MDLNEVVDALDEMRGDDEEPTDSALVMSCKAGQVAETEIMLDEVGPHVSEADLAEYYRDAIGGVIVAAANYASEKNIDLETAIDERIEYMESMAEDVDEDDFDDGASSPTFY